MKIVKITCPGCGAKLDAQENTSRVLCDFCGSSVVVEDSRQEGFNMEKGRMEARKSVHDEIADSINEIINPLCNFDSLKSEIDNLKKQYKSVNSSINRYEKNPYLYVYLYPSLITALVLWLLYICSAGGILFACFYVLCLVCFMLSKGILDKKQMSRKKRVNDMNSEITSKENLLNSYKEILNKHSGIHINKKYHNERALCFIRDAIRSQQALTIEHASSLYEELLMKEHQLKMQKEQLELQRESNELQQQQINETKKLRRSNNARAGASAVGGALVAGAILKGLTKRR